MPKKKQTAEDVFNDMETAAGEAGLDFDMPEEFEKLNPYQQRYAIRRGSLPAEAKYKSAQWALDRDIPKNQACSYVYRYGKNEKITKCIKHYRDAYFGEGMERLVPKAVSAVERELDNEDGRGNPMKAVELVFKVTGKLVEKTETTVNMTKAPSVVMALPGGFVEKSDD